MWRTIAKACCASYLEHVVGQAPEPDQLREEGGVTDGKAYACLRNRYEEIPAFDLAGAVKQLSVMVPNLLDDAAIPHGDVKIFSSPRRLIVIAEEIPRLRKRKTKYSRALLPRSLLMLMVIPPKLPRALLAARA